MKQEINLNINAIERIKQEIEFTKSVNQKAVGNFLLEEFKKDEVLKNDYQEKKITLDDVMKFIFETARAMAKGEATLMLEDKEVYGMAVHYIHDGKIEIKKDDSYTLTRQDKADLEQKAKDEYLREQKQLLAKKEKKKAEKEKAKNQELGIMNLFEDFGDENVE